MEEVDSKTNQQYLRSIIIHSLDNFNYKNAEFAGERLLAIDNDDLDSIYLYSLTLFRQDKFKSCHNRLVRLLSVNHIGCSFLFARCCLHLKRYKEGIYQLLKVSHLFSDSALGLSPNSTAFVTPQQRYNYEHSRSVYPDSSTIYHTLGELYKGIGDVKNSSLNYSLSLKLNPFNFEAFQELCKLGVNVKVKALYKFCNDNNNSNFESEALKFKQSSDLYLLSNPFANNATNDLLHPDDTFNTSLATPRLKPVSIPDAPLRRSNTNTFSGKSTEFSKPNDSLDKSLRRESTYSKITSRLISQPNSNKGSDSINNISGSNNNQKPVMRSGLKRNSSSSFVPTSNNDKHNMSMSIMASKDIECSDRALILLYLIFAKAYKCLSKYDCFKAIRILEALPVSEKDTPWVLSSLGRLHYEIVNYKQSEYYFVQLRKLDRTRLQDMEYYSTLLWQLHKKVELTYLANELHDLDANSPITWCAIGNLFSLIREPDEAIKCFNKSIKIGENFTYAYTLRGHEYFGCDNYEMALESFRISLLIDSRHYNALYGIGMVYINLGDYQKADYHFRKAVSINPINIILICCAGMVLEKLGKKNMALRQYELANKLQPLNPLPMFKKAQLLFSMQKFPQALKYFEILKDLAPDEASVHFLLGQLYNIQNDKYQAIREFTIALNLDPKGNYLIREAMESLKEK
ncbi:uncharacterized protein PRCAT00001687001 [Priceomyces carsonii]|uniref:uncharacterized protein n=1 Tax=Priceomyces carsonii TaxID=28549 RepID=UPI002ED7C2A8|nr:unnamed protein product [Priceomyces carsonii]